MSHDLASFSLSNASSRCYLVGGAVRDGLLKQSGSHDRDWVVVGSDPQTLLSMGFEPVGKDFPVFLHPETKEEFALARTERKTHKGYHGFTFYASPEVSLEDDLARRDLTINAMAVLCPVQNPLEAGRLIHWKWDRHEVIAPHGGLNDLENKIFRHVSPAFKEDPVRLLRLARLAARLPEFSLCQETHDFIIQMIHDREIHALVAERVWKEISKGLLEKKASQMIQLLIHCEAWPIIAPEITSETAFDMIDHAHELNASLEVRYACLTHLCSLDELNHLSHRWKVPHTCHDMAQLLCKYAFLIKQSDTASSETLVQTLEHLDAFRRPERFYQALQAYTIFSASSSHSITRLQKALEATQAIKVRDLLSTQQLNSQESSSHIKEALFKARQQAIEKSSL